MAASRQRNVGLDTIVSLLYEDENEEVLLQNNVLLHNNDKSCDEKVEVLIMVIMIKEILIYLHNELKGQI
jgi:hypothetical protein